MKGAASPYSCIISTLPGAPCMGAFILQRGFRRGAATGGMSGSNGASECIGRPSSSLVFW